ncbi:MAG: type II toxin-antitoxin system HicB family antitoxin [archaeon]
MQRTFSAVITKGEIAFVAYCPELGVTSQGKTKKTALKNLNEAIELYLDDKEVKESVVKETIKSCEKHFKKHGFRSMSLEELNKLCNNK